MVSTTAPNRPIMSIIPAIMILRCPVLAALLRFFGDTFEHFGQLVNRLDAADLFLFRPQHGLTRKGFRGFHAGHQTVEAVLPVFAHRGLDRGLFNDADGLIQRHPRRARGAPSGGRRRACWYRGDKG